MLLALLIACATDNVIELGGDTASLGSSPDALDTSSDPEPDGTKSGDTDSDDTAAGGDTAGTDEIPDGDSGGVDTGGQTWDGPTHPTIPPNPPAYSGGICPNLIGGPTNGTSLNTGFLSDGIERSFRLLVPESYDGSEPVPLVFAWHWINASSSSFIEDGELESAVDQMNFIAVFPDSLDSYLFDWPFFETWGEASELIFFEDLLGCIIEQYNIDPYQVHGIGVSAGALWLTYLSTKPQIQYLASVMSLSGGLADAYGFWEMPYVAQERKFPALVLDGGPGDWFILDFYTATARYREALLDDGHFVVYCSHDQGHDMPPLEPPKPGWTRFYAFWQFMFDHPYDLQPGQSPYLEDGLPWYYPEWCEIPG